MSFFKGLPESRQVLYLMHSRIFSEPEKKATQNAKQSIEYGTKIVGGVTPGKNGEHLELPVLPSVRAVSQAFFALPPSIGQNQCARWSGPEILDLNQSKLKLYTWATIRPKARLNRTIRPLVQQP